MKNNTLLFFIILCLSACSKDKKAITHLEDYTTYLGQMELVSADPLTAELKFWSERLTKMPKDETSLIKLAAIHAQLFRSTGLIHHILRSDSLYKKVLSRYPEGNVELLHSLSVNAISQHHFQDAKKYAEDALALKDKKAMSLLSLADASIEVGDYARANQILRQFKNKNSFAYRIRKAKLQDHEGLLDSAIITMEKAYQRVKGNRSMAHWTLTNLADLYGHAGRIEESYATYLKVLKENPNDDYALKGIAWIALSHDRNSHAAKNIINKLAAKKRMPEAHLMLAEVAGLENNNKERIIHLNQFRAMTSPGGYEKMYQKYLAQLEAETFGHPDKAINMAKDEILNRPTPQSYDLLAWAYYHAGNPEQALILAQQKVENHTSEPESLYHLGMIYQANGNNAKAREYLQRALDSEFELGPAADNRIRTAIADL